MNAKELFKQWYNTKYRGDLMDSDGLSKDFEDAIKFTLQQVAERLKGIRHQDEIAEFIQELENPANE